MVEKSRMGRCMSLTLQDSKGILQKSIETCFRKTLKYPINHLGIVQSKITIRYHLWEHNENQSIWTCVFIGICFNQLDR